MREAIEDIASTYQDPEEVINWYYSENEQLAGDRVTGAGGRCGREVALGSCHRRSRVQLSGRLGQGPSRCARLTRYSKESV